MSNALELHRARAVQAFPDQKLTRLATQPCRVKTSVSPLSLRSPCLPSQSHAHAPICISRTRNSHESRLDRAATHRPQPQPTSHAKPLAPRSPLDFYFAFPVQRRPWAPRWPHFRAASRRHRRTSLSLFSVVLGRLAGLVLEQRAEGTAASLRDVWRDTRRRR